jgi:hypothetical protein
VGSIVYPRLLFFPLLSSFPTDWPGTLIAKPDELPDDNSERNLQQQKNHY